MIVITEITAQEYETLDQSPKMIEFFSRTCGPCKMLSYVLKDIAKMTGMSEVAIRKAVSRARQAVREIYLNQYNKEE